MRARQPEEGCTAAWRCSTSFVVHSAFDTENEAALQTYIDEKVRLTATSFCWGDKDYVFVGTADDSLIQILLQFDREQQQFRTIHFSEEERYKADGSIGVFKRMRLHSRGLFCSGVDDIIRLIRFESQDATLQEATNITDLIELNAPVTALTFNPTYTMLFISSTQGVDTFDLTTMEQHEFSLIPNAFGKIVDVTIVSPASELIVTARDSGALEAWSITDGTRKFFVQIDNQSISHVVASPTIALLVVTTTAGAFFFFDMTTDGFRLIHRVRLHSNDVRCVKFNTRGNILVSAGLDNNLFVMKIDTDQTTMENMFQIIYRADLDGEPFALDLDDYDQQATDVNMDDPPREHTDEHADSTKGKSNETRIIVSLNTKTEKFGRFLILDFDWQQYRGMARRTY